VNKFAGERRKENGDKRGVVRRCLRISKSEKNNQQGGSGESLGGREWSGKSVIIWSGGGGLGGSSRHSNRKKGA